MKPLATGKCRKNGCPINLVKMLEKKRQSQLAAYTTFRTQRKNSHKSIVDPKEWQVEPKSLLDAHFLNSDVKILHSKFDSNSDISTSAMKSSFPCDGSITNFDSWSSGFDIGACVEVIEHMEENQASEFGNGLIVLFNGGDDDIPWRPRKRTRNSFIINFGHRQQQNKESPMT
ncbi:hypothetical protein ACFX1S_046376 [Malus domestica]